MKSITCATHSMEVIGLAASREGLANAKAAGEMDAVATLALALVQAGDEGEPMGLHRLEAGVALILEGKPIEAVPILKAAADMLPVGSLQRARALANGAVASEYGGLYASLQECALRCLQEFSGRMEPEFRLQVGMSHHAMGKVHDLSKRWDEAAHHYSMAVACYEQPSRRLNALCDQSLSEAMRGNLALADELLGQIDPTLLQHHPRRQFTYHATMCAVRHLQGNYRAALEHGEMALKLDLSNNRPSEAVLYLWLTKTALQLGFKDKAIHFHSQSWDRWKETHSGVADELTKLEGELYRA